MNYPQIILGVDPGTNIMGFAVIKIWNPNHYEVLKMGVFNLSKLKEAYQKLGEIYKNTTSIIQEYKPQCLSIEAPFYGKNVQSMLKLGRAQGIVIAAAIAENIGVFEYAPKKVKQSITGNGNQTKEQVWKILAQLFKIETQVDYYDASDALGIALCHYFQNNTPVINTSKKSKDWSSFISQNQHRIKN